MRGVAIVGFVAAIALGLAAGTGATLALRKPAVAEERAASLDSAAERDSSDSTRHSPDSTDASSSVPLAPGVTAPNPAIVLPRPPELEGSAMVARRPAPDSVAANRARAREAARERLAKMFTAMEPKGAASVLEQLDDDEAARILGAVSERQAGKILEYLTPQRAAAVSRALLNSSRSTP